MYDSISFSIKLESTMKLFLKYLLFWIIFLSQLGCSIDRRPINLVVFFTDDQRFNTIHALGNEEILTPNMDRLVRMGVSFTQAYVMGSLHGAVCAPSRAMLLTGQPYMSIPREFVDRGHAPADKRFEFITFPELLKNKGYTTFFTGKWHNHTSKIPESFSKGDNIFIGGMHWPKDGGHHRPQLWHFDSTAVFDEQDKWQASEFSSKMYSNAAIEFLEQQPPSNPFCLYVAYTSPHDPREAPDEFARLYDPANISLPENFAPQHPFDNGHLRTRDENLLPFPRTEASIKKEIAAYYAMISEVDAQIGRVLDALEEKKCLDKTVIVFAGDNGLAVGQHGLLGKQNLYEHSVRVPLIIAAPGIKGNRITPALSYLHDIYPTICDLLGLKTPSGVEGESLFPILKNQQDKHRDHLLLAHAREMRAIRTADDWKLIRYFVKGETREQLFNLREDEWETHDLSDNSDYSSKKEELKSLLLQSTQAYEDDFIRPFIHYARSSVDGPVKVSISSSFPEAEIRYSINGDLPDRKSSVYEQPFMLEQSALIRAAVFGGDEMIGQVDSAEVKINSEVENIILPSLPSPKYPGAGRITLMDGANGTANFQNGNWLGFEGEDVETTVVFKKQRSVSKIGIRFLNQPGAWIFPPKGFKVLASTDGARFWTIAEMNDLSASFTDKPGPQEFKMTVPPQKARFIKFEIENQGFCPDWHPGKGQKAWLFLDELFLED
jgi:arylsulfatase A-like enzyme